MGGPSVGPPMHDPHEPSGPRPMPQGALAPAPYKRTSGPSHGGGGLGEHLNAKPPADPYAAPSYTSNSYQGGSYSSPAPAPASTGYNSGYGSNYGYSTGQGGYENYSYSNSGGAGDAGYGASEPAYTAQEYDSTIRARILIPTITSLIIILN
ncbi:unnamed protein product [Pieris macdunnoughi]|uniref:Uncharacterized protein n=1 Tax=Pieris macdunnoughi TaxID=345717 RepID=A0A821TZ77_9NEOP|nr:unnamed protein product [Pieris macdunnoughi]